MLPDGEYDALVVDATSTIDAVRIELAIVSGQHKGDVVSIRASGLERDPVSLLGEPVILIVEHGSPRVEL